ncbi:chromosomal replication initiator protein DnaA [Patescibacteria group bacterium]|nr:chromosomal replication initiator protein DnaA [Patescibacteria group bacterium]MBU4000442.1 chromosomal replication initiator protein DnaA [Patescibacteria group bacterium]MBU4057199.1 chromosomal replication initiator protein DnaA [Patescibacteria group bacterium]MBU4368221.1 chromosomal replication initiator protein DnaA [Patescibacteria group bacterium]
MDTKISNPVRDKSLCGDSGLNNQDLWQTVLGQIELLLSKANFTTWFKNTAIVSRDKNEVVIGVPNGFTKEWLENKYHKFIVKSLEEATGETKIIKYIISAAVRSNNFAKKAEGPKNTNGFAGKGKEWASAPVDLARNAISNGVVSAANINLETNLNPRYTFDNFIVGGNNELAHAASMSITKNLGTNYNPFFIYGGVGLGKTHLLQAVGNRVLEIYNNKKVYYTTSEKFASELISSISDKKVEKFKSRYQQIDLLVIDDIQFLAGKEKTQEEFFHIFNALYQKNKQIVISSDRPPKAIPTLEERLISRFEGGMIADITLPDFETRMAILKAKVGEKNLNISNEILTYIATHIQKNVRELEGALNRVIALIEFNPKTVTIKSVQGVLSDMAPSFYRRATTPKEILKIVADFYNTGVDDLCAKNRRREVVKPRQVAMFLMRVEINSSFPSIGEILGNRDHTTAMHAFQKIQRAVVEDKNIEQEINMIKQRLYNK